MNKLIIPIAIVLLLVIGYFIVRDNDADVLFESDSVTEVTESSQNTSEVVEDTTNEFSITPISHATMVLSSGDTVIYVDPVGGQEAFVGQQQPDLVLVTDIHGDHLSVETLQAVVATNTRIIAPQAVADEFTDSLRTQTLVLANGEETDMFNITIEAMPMYNLPEQGIEIRHEEGRGNGYLLTLGNERVYIAGDTADIPEMRALEDIDIAFVPMNLPYTMDVERAADGVVAFAPVRVYPYHYRTPEGFSDVNRFKELVNEENPNIEVVLLDWYPESE